MGLFNFIYKLTNILSNKRKIKVFIIVLLVILLLFFWSRGSFAATPEEADALTNYQLCLQQAVFSQLTDLVRNGMWSPSQNQNFVNNVKWNFVYLNTTVSDNAQIIIHLYRLNRNDNGTIRNTPQDFTIDGSWEIGINSQGQGSTQYPCKLAEFWGPSVVYSYGTPPTVSQPVFRSFYLPDACFCVRSTSVNDFLEACNEVSELPTTYNTSDAELQAITRSGFQNQVNAINNMNETMQDVNSSVEDVNQSIQDVNQSVMDMIDTIVDPYVNVSQEQLPESNVQDENFTDGVDNLFMYIKNAFTGTPQSVSFPIPFTDKSFTIEPGFTENSMRKGGLSAMVSIIHLYWYYRIYSFIFLKYVELLEKLKEGEFEQTVGNIKKEVL